MAAGEHPPPRSKPLPTLLCSSTARTCNQRVVWQLVSNTLLQTLANLALLRHILHLWLVSGAATHML